jgi:hypothetical protein
MYSRWHKWVSLCVLFFGRSVFLTSSPRVLMISRREIDLESEVMKKGSVDVLKGGGEAFAVSSCVRLDDAVSLGSLD